MKNPQPSYLLIIRRPQRTMSHKRMNEHRPQKLTAFFHKPPPKVSQTQDGAGTAETHEAYTDLPDEIQGVLEPHSTFLSPSHRSEANPITGSPAKARTRMDSQPPDPQIEAQAFHHFHSKQALQSSMASFPTTGQPVTDTTCKDMLLSHQSSLMTDISSLFTRYACNG